MFDSVLDRGAVPEQRYGAGALFTAGVIAILVPTLIWASTRPLKKEKKEAEVTFFAGAPAPPPPPPPPPLGGSHESKPVEHKPTPVKRPDTIYDTKDMKPRETEKPKEATEKPAVEGGVAGGVEGGVAGGVVGGVVGGVIGGTLGGQLGGTLGATGNGGNSTIPFGAGMNRPTKTGGPDVVYTREAREAKVEGVILAKCTITTTGSVQGCSIVKSLPFLDQAVLSALSQQHYTPVMFNGKAQSVTYTFNFRMKLQ